MLLHTLHMFTGFLLFAHSVIKYIFNKELLTFFLSQFWIDFQGLSRLCSGWYNYLIDWEDSFSVSTFSNYFCIHFTAPINIVVILLKCTISFHICTIYNITIWKYILTSLHLEMSNTWNLNIFNLLFDFLKL